MAIASSIIAVVMAIIVIFIRIKAAKKPATAKKIILPPIFMSTGALMFLHPMFHVSILNIVEALSVGILFSFFLIKTSNFEIKGNDIFLKRSRAFIFILLGLLIVRVVMKLYLSAMIDYGELAGMFWILAFGMIIPWRITMYLSFRKIQKSLIVNPNTK